MKRKLDDFDPEIHAQPRKRKLRPDILHYMTCTEGGSNKFYEIYVENMRVISRYGKVGLNGSSVFKDFETDDEIEQYIDKLVQEKSSKGYVDQLEPQYFDNAAVGAPVAAPLPKASSSNAKVTNEEWACAACTYVNNATISPNICDICGAAKNLKKQDGNVDVDSDVDEDAEEQVMTLQRIHSATDGSDLLTVRRNGNQVTVAHNLMHVTGDGVITAKVERLQGRDSNDARRLVDELLADKIAAGFDLLETDVEEDYDDHEGDEDDNDANDEDDDYDEDEDEAEGKAGDGPITIYLECRQGGSNKFYSITLSEDGMGVDVHYGAIGGAGVHGNSRFPTRAAAIAFIEKTARTKRNKGYRDAADPNRGYGHAAVAVLAAAKRATPKVVRRVQAPALAANNRNNDDSNQGNGRVVYMECREGRSDKFYSLTLSNCGLKVEVRYGARGNDGARSEKVFATREFANRFIDKTAAEKKKKGYRDVANPDGNNGNAFNHVVDNQNDDDEDDDHTPAERLEAGEKVLVQGSSKLPYTLRKFNGGYSCSCRGFISTMRGGNRGIAAATCKHLKEVRGEEAERVRTEGAMANNDPVLARQQREDRRPDIVGRVTLAHKWKEGTTLNRGDWVMSEKLDGMRAFYSRGRLWSRNGLPIACPAFFLQGLPLDDPHLELDGELFLRRGAFEDTMSIARRLDGGEAWRELKFVVFDCPSAPRGGIVGRLDHAARYVVAGVTPYVILHPHEPCEGEQHLMERLAEIEALGGEGLMLRKTQAAHRGGRTNDLLKVKSFHDDEALVLDHEGGKGRLEGQVGALLCINRQGALFKVGSGLTDAMRTARTAPQKGTVITFKYFELTRDGIPRFPTFLRIRPDVAATEFPRRPNVYATTG